jgi:hypothetical protein
LVDQLNDPPQAIFHYFRLQDKKNQHQMQYDKQIEMNNQDEKIHEKSGEQKLLKNRHFHENNMKEALRE